MDWNIEIEKDDAADEAEYYLRVDAEAADTEERSRSPLASFYGTDHPGLRRGPYNRYSEENPGTAITESIDAEEGLPGCKTVWGYSHRAQIRRGQCWRSSSEVRVIIYFYSSDTHLIPQESAIYKTMKESMRVEKDAGPPYLLDESLNYHEGTCLSTRFYRPLNCS
jgi:hypothetical protein